MRRNIRRTHQRLQFLQATASDGLGIISNPADPEDVTLTRMTSSQFERLELLPASRYSALLTSLMRGSAASIRLR